MTPLELLAPARNADIGIAAIRCGADAVYIGGPAFGARSAAGNSIDDIDRLCSYASRFGARIYVTVNTLADGKKEREEAVTMMEAMRGIGISAFILQDSSLLPSLKERGKWEEEFHASTQCAIRTAERATELAAMGFSRLILERQLSLEQIKAIRKAVPSEVELEFFVHGALCVCYSGDCYLSEALTGRSANRGECAQPCRSLYDLIDDKGAVLVKNKPLLSLKDLQLIGRMEELAAEGIVSFKIEGRLKSESYVKNTVRAYSEALDKIIARNPDRWRRSSLGKCVGGFSANLDKTFNRGYTQLFLDGEKHDWNSGDAAGGLGEHVGEVIRTDGRKLVMAPAANGLTIHNGDGLCYVDGHGAIQGFRAEKAENGRDVTISVKDDIRLRSGQKIWRNNDVEFERSLDRNMPERMLRADISLIVSSSPDNDGSLSCRITAKGRREDGAVCTKEYMQEGLAAANNTERMTSMLESQLSKSCDGIIFTYSGMVTDGGNLPLLSAAFINSIRRDVAASLNAQPISSMPVKGANLPEGLTEMKLPHPKREGELMRSRYCIRAELGLCGKASGRLFLRNNSCVFPLEFDCAACEMVVRKQQKR